MSQPLPTTLTLRNGVQVPRLGQGTWYMGEQMGRRREEIASIRRGIELGMTLIDTAEMYGEGLAESLLGEALHGVDRDEVFLVSKVYPQNAGRGKLERSLDNTLRRMKVDHLDLYLLHWMGHIPLAETVQCMEQAVQKGKIAAWGVSNLDTDEMRRLVRCPDGEHCLVDQVLYNLGSRGTEFDLQPWLIRHEMAVMAYSPIAHDPTMQRRLFTSRAVRDAARSHDATPAQVLLNFILHRTHVIAIPKAGSLHHVEENAAALDFVLSPEEYARLDQAFPAPTRKVYLDML